MRHDKLGNLHYWSLTAWRGYSLFIVADSHSKS